MKMDNTRLVVISFIFLHLFLRSETKSRVNYDKKLALAQEHYKRVQPQIYCGVPRPRIFRINNLSMKRLSPEATVLHRCGEQAGCCTIPSYKCVAKKKEKVRLYFIVRSSPRDPPGQKNKIKKYVFANHTECHCVDMSYRPR